MAKLGPFSTFVVLVNGPISTSLGPFNNLGVSVNGPKSSSEADELDWSRLTGTQHTSASGVRKRLGSVFRGFGTF